MKEEKDKLRDFMQGVFQDYEVAPDPEDWDRIEKTLSEKKKRRIIPWIIWTSAASLLVLMAIYTGGILNHSEKGTTRTVVNQNTSHKPRLATDQKTKLAANVATQINTGKKQSTVNVPVGKINPGKLSTLTSSIPEKNTGKVSNNIANNQVGINSVRSNDATTTLGNTGLVVHSINPKIAVLIKYPNLLGLRKPPVIDVLHGEIKDVLASTSKGSNIHFKGLSLSNSSGLIMQNSSGTPFMAYSASFASQLATNIYTNSVKVFDNLYLSSINIGSLLRDKTRNYMPPVTFGLNINLSLQPNWSIETGIQYTRLQSSGLVSISSSNAVQFATSFNYNVKENLHYLGVPFIINYSFAQHKKTSYYLSGGLSIEKGLVAKYIADPEDNLPGMEPIYSHNSIRGLQYSLSTGVGFSYKFIRHFELFGQPSVSYYFNSLGDKTTVYSIHPLLFNLRTGIRYTIK